MAKVDHRLETIDRRLFDEAKTFLAGGVNSPVRSFKAVDGKPVFMKSARGSKLYSEDGRDFIDYCMGWGSLILGHADERVIAALKDALERGILFGAPTEKETELAGMICSALPSIEKLRFTNSGTEAVMSAIRLARAFTKRSGILKFEGSYHGHADYLLDCEGVPAEFKTKVFTTPYNDIKKAEEKLNTHHGDIAAIIVEPVAANMGVVPPRIEFLKLLRKKADEYNIVLVFDEVITAFRLGYQGAQGLFGIRPDLTCLGKIIGGGLPAGAFGGRGDIMKLVAPEGPVYQAGTFSGNPMTMASGIATLNILKSGAPYNALEKKTEDLSLGILKSAKRYGVKVSVNRSGSLFSLFFTDTPVIDYQGVKRSSAGLFKKLHRALLDEGIYLSPSGLEANFLSAAHSEDDMGVTMSAIDKIFKNFGGSL